ncbi:hypothetical protein BKA70DRAFT_1436305 [Coprinopsis sp. MPI-PUGE-AT-0042]|nr:hypothetical protein BKA70DRAFT_1436305 [Coprinopsis sp. MPI-PUGE-AT-0042]
MNFFKQQLLVAFFCVAAAVATPTPQGGLQEGERCTTSSARPTDAAAWFLQSNTAFLPVLFAKVPPDDGDHVMNVCSELWDTSW